MQLNKYIGNQIKALRLKRGLTQDDLAEKLNTTRQTISRYENGDRKANQDVLFELSKILNVSINDFFPEQDNRKDVKKDKIETIAAHIDDDVTEEEMEDIRKYIEFVKSQRK